MAFQDKCVFADSCKHAGDEQVCNFSCFAYAFMHGVEGGSGGLWNTSGVPKAYRKCRISNLPIKEENPKAYAMAQKYVANVLTLVLEKPTGLLLYSLPAKDNPFGTGTGKTTTAVTILNHFLIERSRAYLRGEMELNANPALFVKATELQNTFNAQFRGTKEMQDEASVRYYNLKNAIKKTELVVLDDIATRGSKISEAFEDELYEMLDYRNTNSLTTIFTSNVNLEEMAKCLGDRIASRIAGMTVQVGFTGKDYRKDFLF
jgi:DNA replication protein DnaC